MSKVRVLVVDDTLLFRETIKHNLTMDEDIEVVATASDAYQARDLILELHPDVMTLDIEMPKMDGQTFLRKLLPQYVIPVIVITSKELTKETVIQWGAVDFMPKPTMGSISGLCAFGHDLCEKVKQAKDAEVIVPTAPIKFQPPKMPTQKPVQKPATTPISQPSQSIHLIIPDDTPKSSAKPISNTQSTTTPILEKVKQSAANVTAAVQRAGFVAKPSAFVEQIDVNSRIKIIALGASTGGTDALQEVIQNLPESMPPIVIVQHMPAGFTRMYAERLNRICKLEVREAQNGDRLMNGLVLIGAGEYHLRLKKDSIGYYVSSERGEKVSGHCPSVDVLFDSVADVAGDVSIGAILTGMGIDGAKGLLKMRNAGAFTIGQDKESCVVYGMPMVAFNNGAVQIQAPLSDIARIIMENIK